MDFENLIVLYFSVYGLIFIYHAYTSIGIGIYSLNAFKLGKKIYSVTIPHNHLTKLLSSLSKMGFQYNDTLYRKFNTVLVRPGNGILSWNNIYKFRIIINKRDAGYHTFSVYTDVISKYNLFLFTYLIPFIISFGKIAESGITMKQLIQPFLIFIIMFTPFMLISGWMQKRAGNKFKSFKIDPFLEEYNTSSN